MGHDIEPVDAEQTSKNLPVRPPENQWLSRKNGNGFKPSLSVDFDEEVLQATKVERVFQKPDGSKWDFERFEFDNANAVPGNAGVDEGFITGAGVFSFTERITLPANTDDEALAFHFRVLPEAPFGTTEVRFVDGAQFPSGGPPIQNAVTMVTPEDSTDLSCPDSEIAPLFIVGRVQIVPDISIFIRGDSNGDQVVNISDAQATLGYLFLGARQPTCLDAADANDDGKVDVSDPISTLDSLFLGGGALPPPNATPAEDPTPDSLGCSFQ